MLLFTVIVLVVALIYFLFLIYWAIIASTKTPSQLTSSNGLWFAVGLDQIPDAIAIGVVMGCILTIPQYSIFHALHLTNDHHPVLRFAIRVLPRSRIRANLRAERTTGTFWTFLACQREDSSTDWRNWDSEAAVSGRISPLTGRIGC